MWMKSRRVITLTLVWFTVTLGSASAEWFVDLYGGGGFTQDSDLDISSDKTSLSAGTGGGTNDFSARAKIEDIETDDFPLFGARVAKEKAMEKPT